MLLPFFINEFLRNLQEKLDRVTTLFSRLVQLLLAHRPAQVLYAEEEKVWPPLEPRDLGQATRTATPAAKWECPV